MTPLEYAEKYKNLEVFLPDDPNPPSGPLPRGQWRTVSVKSYRLGLEDGGAKNDFLRKVRPYINQKDESITVWVKTVKGAVESKTYTSRSQLAENAVDAFYGKGSPEEVQVTLQLGVRFGLIGRDQVQAYCDDDHIGLDCNGFVGNYIRHVLQGKPWDLDPAKKSKELGASSLIQSIMKAGQPVATVKEIIDNPHRIYLMALVNNHGVILGHNPTGHIVVTDPYSLQQRLYCRIVNIDGHKFAGWSQWHANSYPGLCTTESTSRLGLVNSYYLILEETKKRDFTMFTVLRGSKQKEMRVRISTVPT